MKILFLTNLYPPAGWGGYEAWCQEVTAHFAASHEMMVLTSRYNRSTEDPAYLHRVLHLEMDFASLRNGVEFFTSRKRRERENLAQLATLSRQFGPQVILVWGMWNLSTQLPAWFEQHFPHKVAYYIGDYWPTLPSQHVFYWQASPRNPLTAIPKKFLKIFANRILQKEQRPQLNFEHMLFPTQFMRNELARQGVKWANEQIIYGGTDLSHYRFSRRNLEDERKPLSLLYVGRLTEDKGVHVAIQALDNLVNQHNFHNVKLRIVGSGQETNYPAYLRKLTNDYNLDKYIEFEGKQPIENMPDIYAASDILLFTSLWHEPFGRVIVEAMATGAVVVGSATGGSAEILVDRYNGLTFLPGNAPELAEKILQLKQNPSLFYQLSDAGPQTAREKFDISIMAKGIEHYLLKLV